MENKKVLRLGLVGCGNMMASHVGGVKYVDNCEIVALCDIVPEKVEKTAKELEMILDTKLKTFTDFRKMVDEVDAVLVALPHDLHFECGMFFAQHNKHILMEKPLCNTEEECLCLIEECEKRGLKLMCGYPLRYQPAFCKLKELLDTGDYGEIMQFSAWTEQLTGSNTTFDNPDYLWVRTARLGGGQLFSHGCHYIDLLMWFLGDPVSGAHVGTKNGTPWMLREGTSAVVMKFANGAIGYHGATWGARGTRMAYDFQIQTEKGMLEFEYNSGEIRFYNGSGEHVPNGGNESQTYNILWRRDDIYTNKQTQYEIKHFAECVLEDKKPFTDGRTALQSLRVIWALYNAEKNDKLADLRGLGFVGLQ